MPNEARRTRLLVSVRTPREAVAALAGGADFIDGKDPAAGALGAVSPEMLRAIVAVVAGQRPVTAAAGDALEPGHTQRIAAALTAAGAAFVKVGFAGVSSRAQIDGLLAAAARGTEPRRLIAVAYADHQSAGTVAPEVILDVAGRARVAGVLVDTADKAGPGLTNLVAPDTVAAWAAVARRHGLLLALAGKLEPADLAVLQRAGADIVGVRGAACDDGRLGLVTAQRVRHLRAQCGSPHGSPDYAASSGSTLPAS